MGTENSNAALQIIDRGLDVLYAFAGEDQLGISELSRRSNLPESAVLRVMYSLAVRGFQEDPGFVDAAHLDFRLKPGAPLLADMPDFQPIPVEKIGLYVDEYRKKAPAAEEIYHYNQRTRREGLE